MAVASTHEHAGNDRVWLVGVRFIFTLRDRLVASPSLKLDKFEVSACFKIY